MCSIHIVRNRGYANMDDKLYLKYIKPFEEFFNRNSKYISNKQIEGYFMINNFQDNEEAISSFKGYYKEISTSRSILNKYNNPAEQQTPPDCETKKNTSIKLEEQLPLPEKHAEFKNSLIIKRYSDKTIKSYTSSLVLAHKWFIKNCNTPLQDINEQLAMKYFLYLTEVQKSSYSLIRIHRFAIEYYFLYILRKPIQLNFMNRMKKEKRLPVILSKEEIEIIIKQIDNIKHRVIISLLYSAGLRVSEVVNIKVSDISLEDLILTIRQGKGKKDRITIFSEKLIDSIKELIEKKKSSDYLFTSKMHSGERLSVRTVQKVFKKALGKSDIKKDVSCHGLRHSFATHLLESGVDLRYIQSLLGHKNVSTTTIYTKVAKSKIYNIKSPL
jgi:integrase/recombinase XerD